METHFINATLNSSVGGVCRFGQNETVSLAVIDVLTFLIGHVVTTQVLWIIFRSKRPIDILNCNLAFLHKLQYWAAVVHLIHLFVFPDIHMFVLNVSRVYSQIGGPMSSSLICMERYVAVIHPASYCLLKKYRCREVCAATVWLVTITVTLLYICSTQSLEVFKIVPLVWMVVMSHVMLWCSIRIAWTLKNSGPARDKMHPMKKRALNTICTTMAITLFCYIPVAQLQWQKIQNQDAYDCDITPVCLLLLSAASIVHPLFYLFNQGKLIVCSTGGKKTG